MLDLPGQPLLDKRTLLGGCAVLASTAPRRPCSCYAPAEGEKPIEDRAPLEQLPYISSIIESIVPAQPLRCLLARLPGATAIPPLMRAGEVWVLNNSAEHAVWNAEPAQARTHLICDFLLSAPLLAMIAAGDCNLGMAMPEDSMASG